MCLILLTNLAWYFLVFDYLLYIRILNKRALVFINFSVEKSFNVIFQTVRSLLLEYLLDIGEILGDIAFYQISIFGTIFIRIN